MLKFPFVDVTLSNVVIKESLYQKTSIILKPESVKHSLQNKVGYLKKVSTKAIDIFGFYMGKNMPIK